MRTLGFQMINEGLMLTRAGYRILLGAIDSLGDVYFRPGGVDQYKRPGGTDLYLRP
jgi:hypothetical protein